MNPHLHPDGEPRVQPLPACLTPAPDTRCPEPGAALPHAGAPVVLSGGYVRYLQRLDPAGQAARACTRLWSARMASPGQLCTGADWRFDIFPLDAHDPALPEDPSLGAVWDLLLTEPGGLPDVTVGPAPAPCAFRPVSADRIATAMHLGLADLMLAAPARPAA